MPTNLPLIDAFPGDKAIDVFRGDKTSLPEIAELERLEAFASALPEEYWQIRIKVIQWLKDLTKGLRFRQKVFRYFASTRARLYEAVTHGRDVINSERTQIGIPPECLTPIIHDGLNS